MFHTLQKLQNKLGEVDNENHQQHRNLGALEDRLEKLSSQIEVSTKSSPSSLKIISQLELLALEVKQTAEQGSEAIDVLNKSVDLQQKHLKKVEERVTSLSRSTSSSKTKQERKNSLLNGELGKLRTCFDNRLKKLEERIQSLLKIQANQGQQDCDRLKGTIKHINDSFRSMEQGLEAKLNKIARGDPPGNFFFLWREGEGKQPAPIYIYIHIHIYTCMFTCRP